MKSSLPTPRDIFAHAIVVAGLFFGASAFFVAPVIEEHENSRSELAAIYAQASERENLAVISTATRTALKQAEQYEQAIEVRSAASEDELTLYEIYRDISTDLGISIDRFDPRPIAVSAPRRTRGKEEAKQLRPDFGASVRVDATGSLDSVISLIDRLNAEAGFVKITSARITPNGETGTGGVRLHLECEHYSFTVPDPKTLTEQEPGTESGGS